MHNSLINTIFAKKLPLNFLIMNSIKINLGSIASYLFVILFTICITACSNETTEYITTDQPLTICVESCLTENEINNISEKIDSSIIHSTRSLGNELTENEAKVILYPLIDDGRCIQKQLLSQKNELALTPQDVYLIENMQEDQLAELSFTFHSIYNNAVTSQEVKGSDIIDCLLYATGVDDISSLIKDGLGIGCVANYYSGTKMLMTAKNATQIIKGFAKRTLGWVGVAWMIYDFGDCLNKKQKC